MDIILTLLIIIIGAWLLCRAVTQRHIRCGNLLWWEDQYGNRVLMSPEGET